MSASWLKPSEHPKDVNRRQAESELHEVGKWLASANSTIDKEDRMERVALIGIWFPKLVPTCRQLARGAAMHPSALLRSEAAAILSWLGNRTDYHCLVTLISDKDPLVRAEAVESLFIVGERLALPHYRRILMGDYDEGMQRAAFHGLDALDNEGRFNEVVNSALTNPKLSELGRGTAIDYQFRWFGEPFIQSWLGLLKSEHFLEYMRPIWTLTESPDLFASLSDESKAQVIVALKAFASQSEADKAYQRWQPKAAGELIQRLKPES